MAAPSAAAGVAAVIGALVLLVAGASGARLPARGGAVRGAPLPRGGATATAVFALGSFWRSEAAFGCLPGVIRTSVGYAGGSKANPEYRNLADHAECVKVQPPPILVCIEMVRSVHVQCSRVLEEIEACFISRVGMLEPASFF
jgi:peptide-methionine (S)-S-oxide reductase